MDFYADQDEDEDWTIGTPLPPLEEDETPSKKPDLDLTVRDEKGRRRFHGAFTGGFSAGYWNTVGSAEGFTPQQFLSTRAERWDQTTAKRKPEDFMDSDDLGVFGIAPQKIQTKDKFKELPFAGLRDSNVSIIDVLKTVIKPTSESIGVKMFRQMKRNLDKKKKITYGCEMPGTNENEFPVSNYNPKSDLHGLGYQSLLKAYNKDQSGSDLSNKISATLSGGKKINITGEAFGCGALEEDNEDDAVVYHSEDMSQYDFEIGGVAAKPKQAKKAITTFEDIEGFVHSSSGVNAKQVFIKKYPPPSIPKHWKPKSFFKGEKHKKSRWDQKKPGEEQKIEAAESSEQSLKKPQFNANLRAVLLGEEIVRISGMKKVVDVDCGKQVENKDDNSNKKQNEFKTPLIGFFGDRFVRSSNIVEEIVLIGGLNQVEKSKRDKAEDKLENAQAFAVERTTYEWHPHSLLCKRFNVAHPYPQFPDVVGIVTVGRSDARNRTHLVSEKKKQTNIFDCLFNVPSEVTSEKESVDEKNVHEDQNITKEDSSSHSKNRMIDEVQDSVEDEESENRPPMDLFKAIFASDEEDEDEGDDGDEDNDDEEEGKSSEKSELEEKEPKSSSESNQLPKGIFSNIDFDLLNKKFDPTIKKSDSRDTKERPDKTNEMELKNNDLNINDDFYGPALPPIIGVIQSADNRDINDFKDKISKNHKRKKKKEHKHKSKKHKKHSSKGKHKKHQSSESSDSEREDVDLKLLKILKNSR